MSTAAKKQKNREYYLKNREKILSRARERNNSKRRDHLEIVPNIRSEDVHSDNSNASDSGLARPTEKIHHLSNTLQGRSRGNSASCRAHTMAADGVLALFDVAYEVSPRSIDNSFIFRGKDTQMEKTLKLVEGMPLKRQASDSEIAVENHLVRKKGRLFSRIPLSFMIRLLLVACLTLLMTAMQVEFYREYDITPGYAVPIALASEVAFLSLVTIKFSRGLDWLRVAVYLMFFGYFVAALSFHVYSKSRIKAASQPVFKVSEISEIGDQMKQAERSLNVATKGRAWKNMEIFGAEVSRLRKILSELPSAQILGTSLDQALWMEAILLILARALLLAASALNAVRLREQLSERDFYNRPTSPGIKVCA